jgi:hypothetical protein
MNGLNRMQKPPAQPSSADYMSAIDRIRAREGMQQAMDIGNATLRAVASLRAALSAWTNKLKRRAAPGRILAKTGVTYFD